MINSLVKKILLCGVFLLIYGLLFYFLFTAQLRLDFSSFYTATLAYTNNLDPYQSLVSSYSAIPEKLPANLNPPFFLHMMRPFTQLNFQNAFTLWFFLSLLLGSIGALASFKLTCTPEYFRKNWLVLLFIYLGMYSTFMNIGVGQIGGFLLFFIMVGYYFYLAKRDYLAGLSWGLIIAIKLFPALLFFFVLSQKRYKVFFIMLGAFFLACLWPYLEKGGSFYMLYFNMLPRVLWFGDNWNASIYGFLFRLLLDSKPYNNLILIKISYYFIFILLLFSYLKKLLSLEKSTPSHSSVDHRAFSVTLVMMLLMSPLGWLYYFSLLLMPITLIWQSLNQRQSISNSLLLAWITSLFLANFPIGYVQASDMGSIFYKLSFYSFHFFGLLLITYLLWCVTPPIQLISGARTKNNCFYALKSTLALGMLTTLSCLLIHLGI